MVDHSVLSSALILHLLTPRALKSVSNHELLTFQVAICVTLLRFQGRFLVTVWFISLGFSTGYSFTDAELSIMRSNPQLGGPGALLSGLPYLSREHPVLRRRVLALTHPRMLLLSILSAVG